MGSTDHKPLVIFDLDGVLVNSLPVMRLAFEAALREVVDPDINTATVEKLFGHYRQHLGKGFLNIMEEINLPQTLFVPFRHHSLYLQHYVYLYPKVRSLIAGLQQYCQLSIVTGKDTARTLSLLKQLKIESYFDEVTGTDGKIAGKPAPDLLLHQMQVLKQSANNVIMIGDSVSDILAAQNADVTSCAALWGYTDSDQMKNKNPDYLASEPYELIAIIHKHFQLSAKIAI